MFHVTSLEKHALYYSFVCLIIYLRFYLFIHKRERERDRQREKQAPCREPDMGLDPGSPGSYPGLKAAPNCWATQAALADHFYWNKGSRRKIEVLEKIYGLS